MVLSGTAGATTATITQTGPMDGTTYDVAVTGMTQSGTVVASMPAGVVQDSAGNLNAASVSANNVVSYDVSPPLVLSSLPADPNPTTAASVNYTVVFSEPVTNVGAGDFQLTTVSGNLSGTAITGVTALSSSAYLVTVSTGTGSGLASTWFRTPA